MITGVRISQEEKRKFMFGALEFLGWLVTHLFATYS